jgi:tRNA nucleotidyltransferase (CCA-adding enzyme)
LEPTAKQKQDASTKHTGVRDALNAKLWVDRAFLTGSYGRSTMIRPPSDIDLFVILDAGKHGKDFFYASDGVDKVLNRFHSILKDAYPTTPIRKDHPAVHLNFSSYGFDVVPAFDRKEGGYVILSRTKSGCSSR